MTLRILVIGRGDGGDEQLTYGPSLVFKACAHANGEIVSNHTPSIPQSCPNCARANGEIVSLEGYDFVFQHLSEANPEAADAIEAWSSRDWRVKIIGFSGAGTVPPEWNPLKIPKMNGLATRDDIRDLSWSNVPTDFSGNAHELVSLLEPPKYAAELTALAVLCQGYLAAHGGSNLEGWNGIPEELRNQAISKQKLVSSLAWWLKVFEHCPDWKNTLINATQELTEKKGHKPDITAAINNLVDALDRGREDTSIDRQTVEAAYAACESLLRDRR
jgi:hypothetical protein